MDNITTIDQSARNTMSVMAWGMTALCAWILVLAAHSCDVYGRSTQYQSPTAQQPTDILSSPRLP